MEENLYDAKDHTLYIVLKVPNIELLSSVGIIPNMKIKKLITHGFGGPVILNVASKKVALSKDIAEKILVRGISL